jgi:RNA polymerase sigma-70 factor (ECF subfamily)
MSGEHSDTHLSDISTLWSVVCDAHGGDEEARRTARQALVTRYGTAVQRYLQKALPEGDAAQDVYQEFALRFVTGAFRSVDPERGRFRDYLKTVLFNLIMDYRRAQKSRWVSLGDGQEPAAEPLAHTDAERAFLESWRDDLLARSWNQLAELELQTGWPMHTALRLRVEAPQLRSPEFAARLTELLGKPFTAAGARQQLHRAREKFADLLLDEVAQSLQKPTVEGLEQELLDLGLLDYCRPRLAQWRRKQ